MARLTSWRAAAAAAVLAACAAPEPVVDGFDAPALAAAMRERPVVLLGEVHDNAVQHAVRAQALRLLLQAGARPALAFEQFDRSQQAEIDRVVARATSSGVNAAVQLAALGAAGWDWNLYRPYLELALQYRLPIVAANLSRADAMRVSKEGLGAVFDAAGQHSLGLDRLPDDLLRAQEREVDRGHCHQMPVDMLPALARAQIARDATLALAIRPYLEMGVVLLTGNGHARRDIGVPRFLPAADRERVVSIGLIERDAPADAAPPGAFDVVFRTPVQQRVDPCLKLPRAALTPGLSPTGVGAGRNSGLPSPAQRAGGRG